MRVMWWVAGLMIGLPLGAGAIENGWTNTDLDFDVSRTFINNENCYADPRSLLSCVNAINAAASLLAEPMVFRRGEHGFQLVKPPPSDPPKNLSESLFRRDEQQRQLQVEVNLHIDTLDKHVDFERLLQKIAESRAPGISLQELLGAAINAHLKTFDPHACLRPTLPLTSLENYTGIGVSLNRSGLGFIVTDVVEGSPAKLAGLSYGDLIRTMDNVGPMTDLTVIHKQTSKTLSLPRVPILLSNVTTEMRDSTVYLRLREFSSGSCFEVRAKLAEFSGAKKIILDLRENSGGNLGEAVCLSSLFVGAKNVVGTRYTGVTIPEKDLLPPPEDTLDIQWKTGNGVNVFKKPMAVLVDAGTASAAEVAAGALQFYKAAWLIGERTFGKGSIRTTSVMDEHPSVTLAATTGLYYFPNGKTNQKVGLSPSFTVPFKPDATLEERFSPRENEDFPDSAAATPNEAWEDSRTTQIEQIRQCLLLHPVVWNGGDDYQKAYASAVLRCAELTNGEDRHFITL